MSHSCVSVNVFLSHFRCVMFIRLGVMFCVYKLSCVFVHFVGYNYVKRSIIVGSSGPKVIYHNAQIALRQCTILTLITS